MYPLVAHWFSPETYGIYIGSTMHEVAQVVAAGHAINPEAENAAVIAKMLRVMMLAPFLIFAARVKQLAPAGGSEKSKNHHSVVCDPVHRGRCLQLFPPAAKSDGGYAGHAGYGPAGDGNGGAGHHHARQRAEKAGAKPLLMALVLFIWLIVGGGAINLAVHSLLA